MKLRRIVCLFLVWLAMLSGCQANPEKNIVASKNDGAFDIRNIQTAEENSGIQKVYDYHERFYSQDGSVEYTLDLNGNIENTSAPIVEVTPYYFTGVDAQRTVSALFGEVDVYYSNQRHKNVLFSRNEILHKLSRWSKYTNNGKIQELYGREKNETVRIVREYIEEFTKLLDVAPDDSPKKLCKWEFTQELLFSLPPEEISKHDLENDNCAIKTELDVGPVHYAYNVVRRDKEDFKMSRVSAYPYGGISPDNIDERYYTALLCRTDAPTEEQVTEAKKKAEQILADLDLGDWYIDQCSVETKWYGNTPEYIIQVTAVPVFENVRAIRRPQLRNLRSEEEFASNFYLTDVEFEFSATGKLVSFELNSPVLVDNVINKNVVTLDMECLIQNAIQHLALYDSGHYGLSIEEINASEKYWGEKLLCKVLIEEMDYGLTRVKIPNTDERYYYVPCIALWGIADYFGEDSGKIYSPSPNATSEKRKNLFIVVNAVDGSIIELGNG